MLSFCLGAALAFIITYVILQKKIAKLNLEKQQASDLEDLKQQLQKELKGVSFEALTSSQQLFLQNAKTFWDQCQTEVKQLYQTNEQKIEAKLTPLKETLSNFSSKITAFQESHHHAQGALKEQISLLFEAHHALKKETIGLSQALRSPVVRGRWGEMHLKRVVELAGMAPYCDFIEQPTTEGFRPDLIVRLPADKEIIIDAKAPLNAYLEANDTEDQHLKEQKLVEHAKHLKNHITALSKKSYFEQFAQSIDFVVLFLPGEVFFSAALQKDPSLIEMAAENKVIIATPTTLIALLRSIAYGWKQDNLSKHAKQIASLGQTLYKRVYDLAVHWNKVGKNLQGAVSSYNKSIGTLESRVLVTARRLKQMQNIEGDAMTTPESLEETTRAFTQIPDID